MLLKTSTAIFDLQPFLPSPATQILQSPNLRARPSLSLRNKEIYNLVVSHHTIVHIETITDFFPPSSYPSSLLHLAHHSSDSVHNPSFQVLIDKLKPIKFSPSQCSFPNHLIDSTEIPLHSSQLRLSSQAASTILTCFLRSDSRMAMAIDQPSFFLYITARGWRQARARRNQP